MSRKAAYRLLRFAAKLGAAVIALVLLAAVVVEHVGAWRDGQVLKQVGRSVDIGGRTLNIHCTGEGSPTVIFVSVGRGLVMSGRQPSAAYPHLRAHAGMTALTSVGVMPDLTLPGATRPRGICISSWRTQDSTLHLFWSAPRLAGTSSACIAIRTQARYPAWCSRMPRTRMPAPYKACPIVKGRRFHAP